MLISLLLPLLLSQLPISICSPPNVPSTYHFTLQRRTGAFPIPPVANFSFLTQELDSVTARFNLTRRSIKGNKVVRKAKAEYGSERLMGEVGRAGTWFARLKLGEPEQSIELDLDMLTADFFVFSTTSMAGSRFWDIGSRTYQHSDERPFLNCRLPKDVVHLPTTNSSVARVAATAQISFAHCRPSKATTNTLHASGAMLGLAPSKSLSQIGAPSLITQLVENGLIKRNVWSIMLIDDQGGVFSIGGTGSNIVDRIKQQIDADLDKMGELERSNMVEQSGDNNLKKRASSDDDDDGDEKDDEWISKYKWTKVQGAAGFWQILMQGVWVNNNKILKNQPVIIDLNTPFILAPPTAVRKFYSSVSGSRPLPPPHDRFHIYPCLNPPAVNFELARSLFPVLQGVARAEGGTVSRFGGKFSLGKWKDGSGYCVGAVVETRMGLVDDGDKDLMMKRRSMGEGVAGGGGGGAGNNGLKDIWVLGESFFAGGIGAAFDVDEQKVGFRTL